MSLQGMGGRFGTSENPRNRNGTRGEGGGELGRDHNVIVPGGLIDSLVAAGSNGWHHQDEIPELDVNLASSHRFFAKSIC